MKNFRSAFGLAVVASLLAVPGVAGAQRLFQTIVQTPDGATTEQTNSAKNIPDLFDARLLEGLISGYDPKTEPFAAKLDLRGLDSILVWNPAGGQLTFSVLGEQVQFTGSDLDDALDDFDAWLEGDLQIDGSSLTLTDLLQGLVEFSPVDPVAGNPNSLQSRMIQTDYRIALEGPMPGDDTPGGWRHGFGVGLDYGYGSGGPYDVHAIDLPLGYRLDSPSRRFSFIASLPLTATFTEGQWSVMFSGGLGGQYRPFDWWTLTAMGRVGVVGSIDVGALAAPWSITGSSRMHFDWRGIRLTIANLGGYMQTINGISIGSLDLSYDLSNPVMTNGGSIGGETGLELRGRPVGWSFFGWNTQIFGDAVYQDSQSEVGLATSLPADGAGGADRASVSLSYQFGNAKYDGLSLRFRYRF